MFHLSKLTFRNDFGFGFRPVYENGAGDGSGAGSGGSSGGPVTTSNQGAQGQGNQGQGGQAGSSQGGSGQTNNGENTNNPLNKINLSPEQQEFVNKIIADEKKAQQEQNRRTIAELTKLQAAQNTTEQQKKELQERINQLQQQHLSKEELAKQEQERQQREYQQQIQQHKTDAETWRNRYQNSTISRALRDAASEAGAFSAAQIEDLLFQKTKLVEEMDEDGKATGNYVPHVHLQETDGDGKIKILDLTVKDAIQKMKNTPERFGNLFNSTMTGGLGQNGSVNGNGGLRGGRKDPSKMTTQEYIEWRKKNPGLEVGSIR